MENREKTVILIGMPGCGKTTLGKRLAARLNRPFLDLDKEIERREGRTIPEIFARDGEEGFRRCETAAFSAAADRGGVLATGGGIVTVETNREIAKRGLVVYIDRPMARILGDIDTGTRPLLAEGAQRLHQLFETRAPLYLAWADIRVENSGSKTETVENIIREVKDYENHGD